MNTAHVERRELLERRRGKVNGADRASRASVSNRDSDGLAIGAGDKHLATAHGVTRAGRVRTEQ